MIALVPSLAESGAVAAIAYFIKQMEPSISACFGIILSAVSPAILVPGMM